MPETLFIADIHLDPRRASIVELFFQFLTHRAQQADALYILGDLFEVWVGDDEDEPIYRQVLTNLSHLTASGVLVFIMRGNRDFLLGKDFVATTGCQLIDEPHMIDLYGIPTLLMHGDSLCTLDVEYQAFRQQVRNPQWQERFLAQPLAQRRILGQQARTQSQTHKNNTSSEAIMDVTPEAVISTLQTHGVYHLIHGHTHRPAVHQLEVNGKTAIRRVVGYWHDESAMILSCTQEGCQLIDFIASKG